MRIQFQGKGRFAGFAKTGLRARRLAHHELRTTHCQPREALTLIEVMIVLGILSIVLSLAAVAVRDWSAHSRLDSAAGRVVEALRFAQGQAMVTGDPAAVEFDPDAESLQCVRSVGSPPYALLSDPLSKRPYQAALAEASGATVDLSSVTFAGQRRVVFDAAGAPSNGGTIVLVHGAATRTITVAPVSGRIEVQ